MTRSQYAELRTKEIGRSMQSDDFSDLERFALRFALAAAFVFGTLFLMALLDMPSETEAAELVALDRADAIQQARAAAKDKQ